MGRFWIRFGSNYHLEHDRWVKGTPGDCEGGWQMQSRWVLWKKRTRTGVGGEQGWDVLVPNAVLITHEN